MGAAQLVSGEAQWAAQLGFSERDESMNMFAQVDEACLALSQKLMRPVKRHDCQLSESLVGQSGGVPRVESELTGTEDILA